MSTLQRYQKFFLFFLFLILSNCIRAQEVAFERVVSGDLSEGKRVFVEAFWKTTEGYSEGASLDEFITDVVDKTWEDWKSLEQLFQKKDPNAFFIYAKQNGKVVGFALFTKTDNKDLKEVYIDQMAINSSEQRSGIGSALIDYFIKTLMPEVERIVLITRRTNVNALAFYVKNNFRECGYMHEGYDSTVYVGYERVIVKIGVA
jgi:ribosomal protein S18 acetylase RimI-like enzyme